MSRSSTGDPQLTLNVLLQHLHDLSQELQQWRDSFISRNLDKNPPDMELVRVVAEGLEGEGYRKQGMTVFRRYQGILLIDYMGLLMAKAFTDEEKEHWEPVFGKIPAPRSESDWERLYIKGYGRVNGLRKYVDLLRDGIQQATQYSIPNPYAVPAEKRSEYTLTQSAAAEMLIGLTKLYFDDPLTKTRAKSRINHAVDNGTVRRVGTRRDSRYSVLDIQHLARQIERDLDAKDREGNAHF